MQIYIIFYLICLIKFAITNASSSTSDQKNKKSNHYNKHAVYKHGSCSKFDNSLHIMNITRKFIGIQNKDNSLASLKYFDPDDIYSINCSNQDLIPIKFQYQFIETLHCIRVEIDFGNITKFRNMTNFSYYMFNYREIAKKNTYLERQPINETTNSLTIYKAHLRPYIICVSFYKNKMDQTKVADLTNDDCNQFNRFLTNDERINDIDLCIDIDTQLHFLSPPTEHHKRFNGIDPELLMVIFIICLLAVILFIITIGHKLIERPKKKRILQQLRDRLYNNQKKAHDTPENQSGIINSSSQAIFKDNAANKQHHNGPIITITDCSSSSHALNYKYEDEPKETDAMLKSDYTTSASSNNNSNSNNDYNQHKVTFVIGETIIEEPYVIDATLADSTDNNTDNNDNNANNNTNNEEEAIKSVSHLLDDKPWITSAPAPVSSSNRISRNNSLTGSNAMMHKDQ